MKSYYLRLLIFLCYSPIFINAQNVVNFTAADGFTNGATLTSKPDWSASSWTVDTSNGGMVTTSTDWKRAAWQKGFTLNEVGDVIKLRVDLNFSGIINEVNAPLFKVGFSAAANVEFTNPAANTVFLSVIDNNDYPSPILHLRHDNNQFALTPDAYLELSTIQGTTASDDLAIEITLTLGQEASSSTIEAKLLNVTDQTETDLGMHTGIDPVVFNAAQSGIYPFFSSQELSKGLSIGSNPSYSVNVSKLTVEAYSTVSLNPTIKRFLRDTSALDRSKYFNLHSTGGDDVEPDLYTTYNATPHGRGFWGPAAVAVQQEGQVGVYPSPSTGTNEVRDVSRYIATEHPRNIYFEGVDKVALSNWVVSYFKNSVGVNLRPEFYEPMNEPFVHARDFYNEPDWDPAAEARVKLEMAQVFSEIGNKIHATPELANIKVIGYAAAYPEFEKSDFLLWNQNMKMFMDEAGDNMDAFSTHIYDGINQVGQDTKRSGSNMEAVLDLIESYSFQKWGIIKPHVISEFGGIVGSTYSDINNVQSIRSQNAMLFGLFERQDVTELTIPFNTGKSTWHITEANNYLPYKAVLYKPVPFGVRKDLITSWEYTDRIYFYELWKNVSGDRIKIKSSNPDVQLQAFKDGNKLYVALNNLDDFEHSVLLDIHPVSNATLTDVRIKSLIINPNEAAQFTDQSTSVIPNSYNLAANETVVLEYTYDTAFSYDNQITLNRHYSNEPTVQAITANSSMTYTFSNVPTSLVGYATLRMSIGRKHEKSKSPTVFVDGQALSVPSNWKGYDQANRTDFFGMIEIDVPVESLQASTSVTLEFPDSDGYLSSLVLITQTYDQSLSSSEKGINRSGEEKLILYPNPAKAVVHVDQKYTGKELRFFTLTGKEVYRAVYNGNAVDVGHLARGLYLVRCESLYAKLVIE